jgi:hypothetical protein
MLRLPHAWLPLASLLSLLLFVAFLPRSSFGSTPAPRRALLLSILSPIEGRFPGDSPPTPLEISPYQLPFRQPSTLRKEEREKRNEERFPGEWFPEGYDVQEAAPVYTSSARTLWTSPRAIEIDAAHEKRLWAQTFPQGATLPPGKLMVNMLVKNEAEHLERTLPLWAKIVDYWIIGVDDANTDDSIAIIKKHLGHLPGEICEVHFDGIGPTWNQVAQLGIKNFPGATVSASTQSNFTSLPELRENCTS